MVRIGCGNLSWHGMFDFNIFLRIGMLESRLRIIFLNVLHPSKRQSYDSKVIFNHNFIRSRALSNQSSHPAIIL